MAVEPEDGGSFTAARDRATGDPDVPLDDAALDAKVRGLLAYGGLPERTAASLLRACRRLPGDGSLVALPARRDDLRSAS